MQSLDYLKMTLPNGVTYTMRYTLTAASVRAEFYSSPKPASPQESAARAWRGMATEIATMAYVEAAIPADAPQGAKPELMPAGLTPEQVQAMYPLELDWYAFSDLRDALDAAIAFRPPSGENAKSETAQENPASQTNG